MMAQNEIGLTAFGGYIPRLRLQRKSITAANAWIAPNLVSKGRGERSMGNWDEDSVTMAVEAARDLLGRSDDRSHVDALFFGSTTMPFADRLNAGIISAALTLDRDVQAVDIASTQRAGTTSLLQGLAAVAAGSAKQALVCAADRRKTRAACAQELEFGDGAAALSVGRDNIIARYLGSHTQTVDFVDHFRGSGEEFDYNWEERWIRDEGYSTIVPDTVRALLQKTSVNPSEITHFVMPCVFPKLGQKLAKACGLEQAKIADTLSAVCGETGSAHALVMLVHTLQTAKPGDKILLVNFGGGCDALLFEVTDLISNMSDRRGILGALADRQEETNYMKFLTFNGLVEWERGMRGEQDKKTALTTLYRNEDTIMGLVGGRCTETGVVQFPRSRISVAPNNPAVDTQEPYKFAERQAHILSWSADYLSFSMNPPNHYGMMVFEGGGRIMMDIADVAPGEVDSGMEVRMVFRIKDFDDQRGFKRYFWKAVPVRDVAKQAQAAE